MLTCLCVGACCHRVSVVYLHRHHDETQANADEFDVYPHGELFTRWEQFIELERWFWTAIIASVASVLIVSQCCVCAFTYIIDLDQT